MKPKDLLNLLLNGTPIRVTKKQLKECEIQGEQSNIFKIFQIEQDCVNLYHINSETVHHDIPFKKVKLIK